MPILNGDLVLISWRGLCFGQRIILTHTCINDGDWNLAQSIRLQLLQIVTSVQAGGVNPITTAYRACLSDNYRLKEIRAQVIRPVRSAWQGESLDLAGTHESNCTVANDAACITLRTNLAGRDQVANKHIGPVPDEASQEGLLIAGYKALLATLAGSLLTPWNPLVGTGVLRPVIVHKDLEVEPSLLTSQLIGDQSRTQYRRTVRVGE